MPTRMVGREKIPTGRGVWDDYHITWDVRNCLFISDRVRIGWIDRDTNIDLVIANKKKELTDALLKKRNLQFDGF